MTALRHGVAVPATARPGARRCPLDLDLLTGVGWDPATQVFAPEPGHPLLGHPVCRVEGCEQEAWDKSGICAGCRFRWKATPDLDVHAFCAGGVSRDHRSQPGLCSVCRIPGFERPATANGLCFSCDGLRRRRGQATPAYVSGDERFPPALPRPSLGGCAVWACQRLAAHRSTRLCGSHDVAWRSAGRPRLEAFCRGALPCVGDRTGRVVLAGLDDRVVAEVLYGIQASLAEGRRVMVKDLRPAVALLRERGARSVAELDTGGQRDPVRWFLRFTADRVALARACPETEQANDVWDLRVWGATGRLSFVGGQVSNRSRGEPSRAITQPWLKQAAKAWAAEALVRMTTGPVRAVIG
ncbi:MAG: hypothetical protein ACRDY5_05865, partial [Acidimicrobiales bacterium]